MCAHIVIALALVGLTSCGAREAETHPETHRGGARVGEPASPPGDAADPAPRPRSEPPPRPPPPAGVKALRRDAIALALSGDGRFLAAGDLAGQALLWDLQRERFLWADPTPEGNRLGRVVFASEAPIYLIGAFHEPDRPWRFWSAEAMERRGELGDAGWIGVDAAIDARGGRALTLSSSRDGLVQRLELWDLGAARVLASLPVERASRGAVAMDEVVKRVAVADDTGGVRVFELDTDTGASPLPVFESRSVIGTDEEARVSRVALSAAGDRLFGAVGPRLMAWSLGVEGAARTVALGDPEVGAPIRGLHRVKHEGAERLVAVVRPVDGGLVFYGEDGAAAGHLDTGCRCEVHALSGDGQVAACGCVEASELRWGRVQGP